MRDPNDLRLAREVPQIHLILGGHDHHYLKQWVSTRTTRCYVYCHLANFWVQNGVYASQVCIEQEAAREGTCVQRMYV